MFSTYSHLLCRLALTTSLLLVITHNALVSAIPTPHLDTTSTSTSLSRHTAGDTVAKNTFTTNVFTTNAYLGAKQSFSSPSKATASLTSVKTTQSKSSSSSSRSKSNENLTPNDSRNPFSTRQSDDITPQTLVANKRYFLKDGRPHGCAASIYFEDALETTGLAPKVLASLSFDNIKVNGNVCDKKFIDNRMEFSSFSFVNNRLGKPVPYRKAARDVIALAGLDRSVRTCGKYKYEVAMQYLFTSNLRPLYEYLLDDFLFIDSRAVSSALDEEDATDSASSYAWMVVMWQTGTTRTCFYRAGLVDETDDESSDVPSTDSSGGNGGQDGNTNGNGAGNSGEGAGDPNPVPTPLIILPSPSTEVFPEETDEPSDPAQPEGSSQIIAATPSPATIAPDFGQGSTFGQAGDQSATTNESETEKSTSSSCFPGNAVVFTAKTMNPSASKPWESRRMSNVEIGDNVMVGDGGGGKAVYSTVFGFTHKDRRNSVRFVRMTTERNRSLTATEGHYVRVWPNGELRTARSVVVGDFLLGVSGLGEGPNAMTVSKERVVSIDTVVEQGVYNAQTMHGDIVVDGFVVSTYTETVKTEAAHALLVPLRALFRWFGLAVAMDKPGNFDSVHFSVAS